MTRVDPSQGVSTIAGVNVLNVASEKWERVRPKAPTPNNEDRAKIQWLRRRSPAVGGVPLASGLYWMKPSTFDFVPPGEEIVYILEGAVDVVIDGGQSVELRAGDTACFPPGINTTWHVLEPTREFFAILG
jgi:uncharacterized cupin superfamily protein